MEFIYLGRNMLSFLCALFNEEKEIEDLINHIAPIVDGLYFVDDESTDRTKELILSNPLINKISLKTIKHTGLCEVARIEALKGVPDDSWVLMCDADERFENLPAIRKWVDSVDSKDYTHVYFDQIEYVDGQRTRWFSKVKLFRKSAVTLSPIIHVDPTFTGDPANFGWQVIHRKTSDKQKMREKEYIETYKKLLNEGLIDQGRYDWFIGLHYYEKG